MKKAALKEILPNVDFLEVLNARTILPGDLKKCRRLAAEASITGVAVSDAHTLGGVGLSLHEFRRI